MASAAPETSATASTGIDGIIAKLLEVRGSRPGKQVNLSENEIRDLCTWEERASKGAQQLTAYQSPFGQAKLLGSLGWRGMDSMSCAQRSSVLCRQPAPSLSTAPTSRKQPPGSDMMLALPTSRLTVTERGSC